MIREIATKRSVETAEEKDDRINTVYYRIKDNRLHELEELRINNLGHKKFFFFAFFI